jgi:hypothetical protein
MRRYNIDQIILQNRGADTAAANDCLARFKEAPPPDIHDVTDLLPTETERAAMGACFAGLDAVQSRLGLDKVVIDRTMIHVVSMADFRRAFAEPIMGAVAYGHAYVPRCESVCDFIRYFSHELAHLASWRVHVLEVTAKEGGLKSRILCQRSGLSVGNLYVGINEAMTESIALEIRREVLLSTRLVTDTEGFLNLRDGTNYSPQIILLQDVSSRLGTSSALLDQLYRDYFNGSLRALGDFFRPWPGLHHVLGLMGVDTKDAHDAALLLGMHHTLEKIRPFISTVALVAD